MLRSPEGSPRLKPADPDLDMRVNEKILTPEYLEQPGAKIALEMCKVLDLPLGQWSGYDTKNLESEEERQKEQTLAENLTNKSGAVYKESYFKFVKR